MKILGLDISSKTGWAIIQDGELLEYGLFLCDDTVSDPLLVPDYRYIQRACDMAEKIHRLVCHHLPDYIYIEATNIGQSRSTQRQLEFFHYSLLEKLQHCCRKAESVRYIDTSAWRSTIGLRLSAEDKKNNKLVRQKKKRGKITPKHLSVRWVNSQFNLSLKLKDNDIADALAISYCGWLKETAKIS